MRNKITFAAAAVFASCAAWCAGHIGYCYPAGAQRGTTVDVLVGGQGIGGKFMVDAGPGVTVEKVTYVNGLTVPNGSQRKYLIDWMDAIEKGKPQPVLPEDTQFWRYSVLFDSLDKLNKLEMSILQRWLFTPRNPLQMSPAINQKVILRLKIAEDALPGKCELRMCSNNDVTNPFPFFIGTEPEIEEPLYVRPDRKPAERPEMPVPGVINGQIFPGECDSTYFRAEKGEVITFEAKARELVPFIGDGVPGHFQAVLEVFDSKNKTLAFADDHHFNPDPVLVFKAPETGRYRLVVRDAIYRGRADFVYRIKATFGTGKFVMPQAPARIKDLVLFDGKSGSVTAPGRLQGVISKPGDKLVFELNASPDKPVVLELFARRLGSPLDGLIRIFDQNGKLVAFNDDHKRPKVGTILQNADSFIIFKAPEKGRYKVELSDTTGAGGKDYFYHLRVDKPRPGFIGYVTPSQVAVPRQGCSKFSAIVERLDGFDGEIKLQLKDAKGYTLAGCTTIPAGAERATLTLAAPKWNSKLVNISICAGHGKEKIIFTPGDESMQAFAYYHLIPAAKWYISPSGGFYTSAFSWRDNASTPVTVERGKSVRLQINVGKLPAKINTVIDSVEAIEPPQGVTVTKPVLVDGVLSFDYQAAKDCKAGEINQLFLVRASYDGYPNRQGIVRRSKGTVTLPVRRIKIK